MNDYLRAAKEAGIDAAKLQLVSISVHSVCATFSTGDSTGVGGNYDTHITILVVVFIETTVNTITRHYYKVEVHHVAS